MDWCLRWWHGRTFADIFGRSEGFAAWDIIFSSDLPFNPQQSLDVMQGMLVMPHAEDVATFQLQGGHSMNGTFTGLGVRSISELQNPLLLCSVLTLCVAVVSRRHPLRGICSRVSRIRSLGDVG